MSNGAATVSQHRGLTIAHVGDTGADDDRDRWLAVEIWLERADRPFYERIRTSQADGCLRHDLIDLNGSPPRDYLCERGPHDVVITHNLWGPPAGSEAEARGGAASSPWHNPSAWRRRFEISGACYLFMFGTDFNAGALSAFIPGYECFDVPAVPMLSVFALRSCHRASDHLSQSITYRDMTAARLRGLPELRMNVGLDLSYTEARGEHLTQLREMVQLEDLRLVGTAISDGDIGHITQSSGLRRLNLDATAVSDAALVHLKELARLECLSLNDTKIGDTGLCHLRELRNLKWLSLINTVVGDAGLDHLTGLKNLESLSLVGTKVTASGVQKMRARLPDCTIDFCSE
jgi:hypothetical protein